MEGRNNGDRGPWRSRYRDHTNRGSRSITSSSGYTSSAGTIVSTGYTSNSSRRLSSSFSLKAAIHLDFLELDEDRSRPTKKSRKEIGTSKETQNKEKMYHHQDVDIAQKEMEEIRILVQEFFLGAPSPSVDDCSSLEAKGGDTGVLDWWLKHLRVGWVLDIADDYASSGKLFEHTFDHARSWILALAKISQAVRFMAPSLCPDRNSVGRPSIFAEEEQQPEIETGNKDSIPDLFQFAQFILETMLKLLVFVDAIAAPNSKIVLQEQEDTIVNRRVLQLYHKLRTLLRVHSALSDDALSAIQWLFGSRPPRGVERIHEKIVSILSGKVAKVAEGIWSTMEQIRMESIDDGDDSSCSLDTQGSSDVHKATQFVVDYIRLLCSHYESVAAIVSKKGASLGDMIREIASSLHKMLVNISESFPNNGLRFLFLLNNSYFIRQKLIYGIFFSPQQNLAALFGKVEVEGYMEIYLQVSWAPVLSCLLNATPLCFGRKYSLLPKFESEFQKTYTTQKLWKVPDPALRRTLRKAIIEKIVPGYANYIEDNRITTPKFSPPELIEMLEELFEG